jgi:hypothetical protein
MSVAISDGLPQVLVRLGEVTVLGGPDGASYADLVAAPDDQLVLNIRLQDVHILICDTWPDLYLIAAITINASGSAFSGWVSATCSDLSGPYAYAWTGQADVALGGAQVEAIKGWLTGTRRLR